MNDFEDRRSAFRYAVLARCELHSFDAKQRAVFIPGQVLDISQSGALIQVEESPPLSPVVLIAFIDHDRATLGAQVVRTQKMPTGKLLLGLKLLEECPYTLFMKLTVETIECVYVREEDEPLRESFR